MKRLYTYNLKKKKTVKNIGLLYHGKQLLNVESRKTIYFFYGAVHILQS